jgi:hypothetical protein
VKSKPGRVYDEFFVNFMIVLDGIGFLNNQFNTKSVDKNGK